MEAIVLFLEVACAIVPAWAFPRGHPKIKFLGVVTTSKSTHIDIIIDRFECLIFTVDCFSLRFHSRSSAILSLAAVYVIVVASQI